MRLKLRALSRFRPRVLTLIVFFAAAAVIALANLSYDEPVIGNVPHRSYGWPLIWQRIVLHGYSFTGFQRAIGWYYSLPRLAANLVVWLVLLAALAAACEWLLRRYRPRPRWRLRTLFAFVALVAALCGWYVRARNRAAIQDPLVGLRGGYGVPLVFVDRWGPKWFDILGMDRLRRRIVLASNWMLRSDQPGNEQLFLQLSRAPELRYLTQFYVDELTPTTANALGRMRQLETLEITVERLTPSLLAALSELAQLRNLSLSISWQRILRGPDAPDDNDARLIDECLAAIGNMTRLEALRLSDLPLHGKGLACLGGLKGLKSLDVCFWNGDWKGSRLEEPVAEDSLRAIATLTQLEWLRLEEMTVHRESLTCLAGLTNLKTLSLSRLYTDDPPMLSHLPPLPRLEALGLEDWYIEDDDLRRLAALPRLKSLYLGKSFSITPAGLKSLGSLDSLEEVQVGQDIVPEEIEAFGAVKRLRRLHLSDITFAWIDGNDLTPDDGKERWVTYSSRFRRAVRALRQSNAGLVIDKESMRIFRKRVSDVGPSYLTVDAFPERPAAWLPGGDLTWMTPQELAAFEQAGGRAGFYGATFPGGPGQEPITAEF